MIDDLDKLVEGLLEGTLSEGDSERFLAHLARCSTCRELVDAHKTVHRSLASLATRAIAPMSADFTDRLLGRLPAPASPGASGRAGPSLAVVLAVAGGLTVLAAIGGLIWSRSGPPTLPAASATSSPSPSPASTAVEAVTTSGITGLTDNQVKGGSPGDEPGPR
ncbi:MAG: zf-HC2 domain-containing protein [Candidatus Riflebacteria bacterium]|nr:zf-HC2 domain-containing protein [Candidatus Riflebacteria bacterium]